MKASISVWFLVACNVGVSYAIEPVTVTAGIVAAVSALWGYADKTHCRVMECCDLHSISTNAKNISVLEDVLRRNVYGQHLMQDIVLRALRGHMLASDPKKALVLSFHGTPGCGKSYVSDFIAQSLYVRGMKSQYVKKFVAGTDFPDASRGAVYKLKISKEIQKTVEKCERSLFIFEDVQKMPPSVLDAVVPFIDYHTDIDGVDYRKSIFLFLSNTGASYINQKTLELWSKGTQREDIIKLHDFETMIRQGAFNEEGGLFKSETITTSLIDHYIPFLPLEEKHVRKCIHDEFLKLGYPTSPPGAAELILEEMTFMPDDVHLYSVTGCKRVSAKVTAYHYGKKFTSF
ncbi:torsin-1A-like [Thrips palmi]|uniref:Torsin-1A-like n=1 Tax=Thrips palmi TaxID=161013 RepID=A0A6P8ZJ92_THRPL|nr:torsin-1A-like [Thrips palmi]XP_034234949.1 torsin-1A-like [Thrips palmi]